MRAIACLAAFCAASLSFANILEYTFDSDAEGWQVANYTTNDGTTFTGFGDAVWNSDGYIQSQDVRFFTYHVSPNLGGIDATAAYGNSLDFDWWSDFAFSTGPEMAVLASDAKHVWFDGNLPATTGFVAQSFTILGDAGWRNADGSVATEADLLAVLGALDYIGFTSDEFGPDFTRIDNVALVPEPGTMLALGLGSLLMIRRRRKAA